MVRCGGLAGADFCVAEGEGEPGGVQTKGLGEAGAFERRDILELYGRFGDDGVERLGTGSAGGKRGNLRGEFRELGAGRSGGGRGGGGGGCGGVVGGGWCGFLGGFWGVRRGGVGGCGGGLGG